MNSAKIHIPVLLKDLLQIFDVKPGQKYIDATVNGGGHASAILEQIGPGGRLLGIDRDCALIEALPVRSPGMDAPNVQLICGSFADLNSIARQEGFQDTDGILFDLGFSSYHLEQSGRGFSFLRDEPLDMRFDPQSNDLTAEIIINDWPRDAVENIFREYGQERFSRRIARAVDDRRKKHRITKTAQLIAVIERAVPRNRGRSRIHPATRIFQALRIAVNDELTHITEGVASACGLLAHDGVIAAISFHSLEDRLIKHIFREKEKEGVVRIMTSKPVRPRTEECQWNPRARSARLRAAKRITQP